jgi:hypothetical protein
VFDTGNSVAAVGLETQIVVVVEIVVAAESRHNNEEGYEYVVDSGWNHHHHHFLETLWKQKVHCFRGRPWNATAGREDAVVGGSDLDTGVLPCAMLCFELWIEHFSWL